MTYYGGVMHPFRQVQSLHFHARISERLKITDSISALTTEISQAIFHIRSVLTEVMQEAKLPSGMKLLARLPISAPQALRSMPRLIMRRSVFSGIKTILTAILI